MRVSTRVVAITSSALALGAPAAVACSPQDYLSPEEWQALSPEQRSENVAHSHDAGEVTGGQPASAAGSDPVDAVPQQADESATRAPSTGSGDSSEPSADLVEETPSKAVAPAPSSAREGGPGRRERERASKGSAVAPRRAVTPAAAEAPVSSGRVVTIAESLTSGRTQRPVVPVRVTIPAAAIQASEAQRFQPSSRSAADRRADRDRRAAARQARVDARAEARETSPTPSASRPAAVTAQRDGERPAAPVWPVLLAALGAAGGLLALLLRRRGGEAGEPVAFPSPPSPVDGLEAELQAMIDERGAAAELGIPPAESPLAVGADASDPQLDGTTDASPMATNSA